MNKILASTSLLMIMSINTYAEGLLDYPNTSNISQEKIKVQSIRNSVGTFDPLAHTEGQIRAGYIILNQNTAQKLSAYSLAGHYHFNTKRWNGFMLGLSTYTVLNLAVRQNKNYINPDFFNENSESFILFSKAFIDGEWGNTELKLGRQSLDTPHADSDDIRMMPNFFTAYTIVNNDIKDLTLRAGLITHMGGWENAGNANHFLDIYKVLGLDSTTQGIFYASAEYEGVTDLSLSLWYYNYHDIANIIYAEAGYNYELSKDIVLTFGLQYDHTQETGASLLNQQASNTYGLSAQVEFKKVGFTFLIAYNKDNSNTGATSLSLGGGPFFTSMEDQTLDAIGSKGNAWMLGAAYSFDIIGIEDLTFGMAYGNFKAENKSLYASKEIDTVIKYSVNKKFSFTAAYATVHFDAGVDDTNNPLEDYTQFRIIANYNF